MQIQPVSDFEVNDIEVSFNNKTYALSELKSNAEDMILVIAAPIYVYTTSYTARPIIGMSALVSLILSVISLLYWGIYSAVKRNNESEKVVKVKRRARIFFIFFISLTVLLFTALAIYSMWVDSHM